MHRSHPSRVRELKHHNQFVRLNRTSSHPSRVRELKHHHIDGVTEVGESHPSRVRELKPVGWWITALVLSRTPRGCVN